jgi:hypothetical protein
MLYTPINNLPQSQRQTKKTSWRGRVITKKLTNHLDEMVSKAKKMKKQTK